jgi:hypothetical protein
MFAGRDSATRSHRFHWIETTIAVAALFALLAVRNAEPEFSALNTTHYSVVNAPSHDPKPRFNCDTEDWTLPVRGVLTLPTITESLRRPFAARFAPMLQTKGFPYNRPPPVI